MHPTVQPICNTKTYSRSSELQQGEHQQQEDKHNADRQRHTFVGEEQTKQGERHEADQLGPMEYVSRLSDCTARQTHDEQNTYTMVYCTSKRRRMEHDSLAQTCRDHNSILSTCLNTVQIM
eukprot:3602935-Heterocapsa_arctica.AAC.1